MRTNLNRREFLMLSRLLGSAAAATAFLTACAQAGLIEPQATHSPTTRTAAPPQPANTITAGAAPSEPEPTTPGATEDAAAAESTLTAEPTPTAPQIDGLAQIALVKTNDRASGVRQAVELLAANGLVAGTIAGADVLLKPNFNSSDPTPGSTHPDVLRALVLKLQEMGAGGITVGDRSGMGDTRKVMKALGVFEMAKELGFETMVFEDLPLEEWTHIRPQSSHWRDGFLAPNACINCDAVVQTCCLKTHRYGGKFTLSLKNSVGLAAKFHPQSGYNYMTELHNSADQRRMIAEINTAYKPALVVLDGVEAFVSGGPARGKKAEPGVILAGIDRVAIDAVGVLLLKQYGADLPGSIFEQEQIARAVELGLGVDSPEKIDFITGDAASQAYAQELKTALEDTPGI